NTPAAKALNPDGAEVHPGAMIAFLLDEESQQALIAACKPLEVAPDHLTLVYLAPDADALDEQKNELIAHLARLACEEAPIAGVINGYGRFAGDEGDDTNALYANFDSPELPDFREELADAAEECGCSDDDRPDAHGFTPHITLTYLDQDAPTPNLQLPQLEITFDRFALVWAGETITFPLTGDDEDDENDVA